MRASSYDAREAIEGTHAGELESTYVPVEERSYP